MLQSEYPVSQICATLGLARSSFYRRSQQTEDRPLRSAIESLAAQYPTYGRWA